MTYKVIVWGTGFVGKMVIRELLHNPEYELVGVIGHFPEVTHNYEREGDWNLWFTVTAESAKRLEAVLDAIRAEAPGCRLISLPAKKRYKLRVEFDLVRQDPGSLADR